MSSFEWYIKEIKLDITKAKVRSVLIEARGKTKTKLIKNSSVKQWQSYVTPLHGDRTEAEAEIERRITTSVTPRCPQYTVTNTSFSVTSNAYMIKLVTLGKGECNLMSHVYFKYKYESKISRVPEFYIQESRPEQLQCSVTTAVIYSKLVTLETLTTYVTPRRKLTYVTPKLGRTKPKEKAYKPVTSKIGEVESPASTPGERSCLCIHNGMDKQTPLQTEGKATAIGSDRKSLQDRAKESELNPSIKKHKPCTYYNCHLQYNYSIIMVISTRVDFAVITAFKHSEQSRRSSKPVRLYKVRRSTSRRSKESRRTNFFYRSGNTNMTGRQTIEGNYWRNYGNVEISTRDVFAVNTVRAYGGSYCLPEQTRLSISRRSMTKRSGESIRTSEIGSKSKTTRTKQLLYEGNYYPNYFNVEISTRDVFAVIKIISKGFEVILFKCGQKPLWYFSSYIKGGGAYGDREVEKRGDKYIEKIPTPESKNEPFSAVFAKKVKKLFPCKKLAIGTFCKIWLYRTKAIVRVAHKNEIYMYDYASNFRTVFSYKLLKQTMSRAMYTSEN